MTPELLRRLETAIYENDACAPFVHTNDMPRPTREEPDPTPEEPDRVRVVRLGVRDKDQRIADILNDAGVVGTTRPAEAADVHRVLILRGAWRALRDSGQAAALALIDLIDAKLAVDYHTAGAHILDDLVRLGVLAAGDRTAVLALCRAPITAELVSRAVRGPWGDEG